MTHPNVKHYSKDDIEKLTRLINEGCIVLSEKEALSEGLTETIKAVAEEIDVKPTQLRKAIKIAYKACLTEEKDNFEEIEDILETVGRG